MATRSHATVIVFVTVWPWLPWSIHVPSSVLIAQVVFLLECGVAATHTVTDANLPTPVWDDKLFNKRVIFWRSEVSCEIKWNELYRVKERLTSVIQLVSVSWSVYWWLLWGTGRVVVCHRSWEDCSWDLESRRGCRQPVVACRDPLACRHSHRYHYCYQVLQPVNCCSHCCQHRL